MALEYLEPNAEAEEPVAPKRPEERTERKIEAAGFSAANERHPDRNEDAFFVDEERGIFGVFDGMGGVAGGQHAAELARDYFESKLKAAPAVTSAKEIERALREMFRGANDLVIDEQGLRRAMGHPEEREMGTTAAVMQLCGEAEGARHAVIGHAGDTRAYRFKHGNLEELTLDDHTKLKDIARSEREEWEMQRMFSGLEDEDALDAMDPKLRPVFGERHFISNVLGVPYMEPRIQTVDVAAGDRLLLMSDGIHDNLTDREIAEVLAREADPQRATEILIGAAQARSRDKDHIRAKPDDMTAVIISVAREK